MHKHKLNLKGYKGKIYYKLAKAFHCKINSSSHNKNTTKTKHMAIIIIIIKSLNTDKN